MKDSGTSIEGLTQLVAHFIAERDWGQYHDPKNLSMLITTEAAELMEIFRWVDNKQSFSMVEDKRKEVEHEIADIFFGLLAFCHRAHIDLPQALHNKMIINAQRYPVEKSKGNNKKYTEL
ncbi:MAG: nucleotide pyrophosphohydrolase [Candidatus Babeliaceae bacterium]